MGRLLDNYDRLQSMPFGQWTARNSDPGLRQMSSQRRDLTSALRRGIREAKRSGDAGKVLSYQDAGNSMGLETSGIGSFDQRKEGDFKFEQDLRTKTGVNQNLTARALLGVDKVGAAEEQPPVGAEPAPDGGDRFVSRLESSPLSFTEQEKAKREASTAAGTFGAPNLFKRRALASEMTAKASNVGAGDPELDDWRKRAKRLGVKDDAFARVYNKAASFT